MTSNGSFLVEAILAFQAFWEGSLIIALLKFLAFIYCAVVIIDVILLLMLQDLKASVRETLKGGHRPAGSPKKYIKRWETILARLGTDNTAQYKIAVLEAEIFAGEVLDAMGYKGSDFQAQLDAIPEGGVESQESLVLAHSVRNRIIQDPDFELSLDDTKEVLKLYRNFFQEVELFE